MKLPDSLDRFLFQEVSSKGFRWMRAAWALTVLGTLLLQLGDVAWLYSKQSFVPLQPDLLSLTAFPRFSILHFVTDPHAVSALFIILLASLFLSALSLWPKVTVTVSVLLLHSFHHRNPLPLGGGDVMLYNIGFLLMISSFCELRKNGTMPIWPYRLLLWQIIVIYLSSLWWKLLGTTWIDGSAIAIAFQNPHFARFDLPITLINALSPLMGYATMVWEFCWVLLLIPPFAKASGGKPKFKFHELTKKILIIAGIFFHLGILIFLRVGSFSLAMLVSYLGLYISGGTAPGALACMYAPIRRSISRLTNLRSRP